MIVDIVRRLTRKRRENTVIRVVSTPHVIGLPRALFLVLAKAEGVFGGRALRGTIHLARLATADI